MTILGLALRHLGAALLAGALTALLVAAALCAAWLLSDPVAALPDAGYAFAGLLAVGLMLAAPVAVVFTVAAAPLATWLGRLHPALGWLAAAGLGAALAGVMTTPKLALLGALGGLLYRGLVERWQRG